MDEGQEAPEDLAERSVALRKILDKLALDVVAIQREQAAIESKLLAIGWLEEDELKTSITGVNRPLPPPPSLPPPLPSVPPPSVLPRPLPPPALAKATDATLLKAAAVGAGLMMGVVIIVLLTVNFARYRVAHDLPASVASSHEQPSSAKASSPVPSASATPPTDSAAVVLPPPSVSIAEPLAPAPIVPAPIAPRGVVLAAPLPLVSSRAVATPPAASVAFAAPSSMGGAPVTGLMTIVCTPKCDSITDNNAPLPPNTPTTVAVPVGTHRLSLSAPNGVKKTVVVNVIAGQTKEVRVAMDQGPRDYGF